MRGLCHDALKGEEMIRQAINCDMCGAEKLETTSHWFVAYEQGGELKLRGWESPKQSRKDVKHLCGQKCVQRLTANFTAAVMAEGQVNKREKDPVAETSELSAGVDDREDVPVLERMGYDRETIVMIEADSWAGPARPRENSREAKTERESFINATRTRPQTAMPFQRMA